MSETISDPQLEALLSQWPQTRLLCNNLGDKKSHMPVIPECIRKFSQTGYKRTQSKHPWVTIASYYTMPICTSYGLSMAHLLKSSRLLRGKVINQKIKWQWALPARDKWPGSQHWGMPEGSQKTGPSRRQVDQEMWTHILLSPSLSSSKPTDWDPFCVTSHLADICPSHSSLPNDS